VLGHVNNVTVRNIDVSVNGKSAVWRHVNDRLFQFTNPQIYGIDPQKGPVDGGTMVTVTGKHLDSGSLIQVYFGDHRSNITRVSENRIVFVTPPVGYTNNISNITVTFDMASRSIDVMFRYVSNPVIQDVFPLSSFRNGSCKLTVVGTSLDCCQTTNLQLSDNEDTFLLTPISRSASELIFLSPFLQRASHLPAMFNISFVFNNVTSVHRVLQKLPAFTFHDNPSIDTFSNDKKEYHGEILTLQGSGLMTSCMGNVAEVTVLVGNEPCNVTLITNTELHCKPPEHEPLGFNSLGQLDDSQLPRVTVRVGNLFYDLGRLQYVQSRLLHMSGWWPVVVGVCGGVLVIIIVILTIIFVHKSSYNERLYRRLQSQLDALESSVRNECKQAFAELQTEVSDIANDLGDIGCPFWDYNTYATKVLFNVHSDCQIMQHSHIDSLNKCGGMCSQKMSGFNQLLGSKYFLVIFIQTLEQQKHFLAPDRAKVASLLMVVLMDDMQYVTEIVKILLNNLIEKAVEKKVPKGMLRRTETVVGTFISHWLALCMYNCLRQNSAGRSLFRLYQAVKRQTEKGPIDAVSGEARYCMTEDRLLKEKVEHTVLTVTVELAVDACSTNPAGSSVVCKMLDCDTISQAKSKALDALYANIPFSCRPSVCDIDLFWKSGKHGRLPLCDEDLTTPCVNGLKRINTLAHYHIKDNSVFIVECRQRHANSLSGDSSPVVMRNIGGCLELDPGVSTLRPIRLENISNDRVWHLVKNDDIIGATNAAASSSSQTPPKVISEIFLTRLLSTKMTLQSFIDELFQSLFQADESLRIPVKFLFDIFDTAAAHFGITDPEVVQMWKSDSLPLRFYVNVIQNPECVFDIDKPSIVDSCLKVVSLTLIDSCVPREHHLGKDSPTTKLLFAKDIPRYRQILSQFYDCIHQMAPVTDSEMKQYMLGMSKTNIAEFNQQAALEQLYQYAHRFRVELQKALDGDSSARNLELTVKFQQIQSVADDVVIPRDVVLNCSEYS
jgi:plexin A